MSGGLRGLCVLVLLAQCGHSGRVGESPGDGRVSMTSRSETPATTITTLTKCCEYQAQFSEQTSACISTSDPNHMLKFDDTLRIPQQALTYVYASNTNRTVGNVTFGLIEGSLRCSQEGSFSVTVNLNNRDPNDPTSLLAFTPNGYLQIGFDYYSSGEYCVDASTDEKVTLAVCKPKCGESSAHPCIPKCCDYGQSWDFGVDESGIPQCTAEADEGPWQPTLYSDRYTKMATDKRKEIVPHFVSHHPSNGWCDYGHPFIISLKHVQDGGSGVVFRLLQDGTVITRVRRRQWAFLPDGDYCLDRTKNLYDKNETSDDTSVILYCHKELGTSESFVSKIYGSSMIVSSLFLVLTLLVFGFLWEKHRHNIQRWTLFAYISSLLLMYIFFILSYFSNVFDSETTTNEGSCRGIGIGMHFFFLSTFCWLTALNFEIWFTVRSFTSPQSRTPDLLTGFRRLIAYGIFAFGLPTIIVSVGLILEAIYENDMDSEVIIPEYGRFTCNIGSREAFWAYMYGPIAFLLTGNMAFFFTTLLTMWRLLHSPKLENSLTLKHQKQSELLSRFAKLYLVMGVPWIFELVSFAAHEDEFRWYWIVLDLINIFQSAAIFIIFVCNRETMLGLQAKFPILKRFLSPLISRTTTPSHTAGPEREEDSGRVSTVDIATTVAPKDALEMT